jgi:membrane fusion protein, multidrug efflux system
VRTPLVIFVALAALPAWAEGPTSDAPSVLVQTAPVRVGSLPKTVSAYGTVQADPTAHAAIMAPVAAIVGGIDVRVGEEVEHGAALVRLVPSPQTGAAYAQAVSALRVASDALKHTRELLSEQLATRQQLADAEKSASDARATLTALEAQGAGGARIVRAPFRAIVTALSTSVRAIVAEGTPLLELARPNGLVLMAGVVPADAAAIARGDVASVTPIGGTQSYAGKVVLRGSVVDPSSGLVTVAIALPVGAFLPGQTAQATITVATVHGYVVPHEAILIDDSGSTYVVQAVRGTARIVHVRVLDAQGASDTIEGPLDRGAPLVLAGNYQLKDGMAVRLAAPAPDASR